VVDIGDRGTDQLIERVIERVIERAEYRRRQRGRVSTPHPSRGLGDPRHLK